MKSYRKSHIRSRIDGSKPKKSIFSKMWFWLVVLSIILVSLFIYVFVFLSYFQIKSILISGNTKSSTEKIKGIINNKADIKIFSLGPIKVSSKSIFLANVSDMVKASLRDLPVIDNIKISRKFPDNVMVDILERKAIAIFCAQNNECFFIDEKGIIFEKIKEGEESLFIVRQDLDNEKNDLGSKVINKDLIDIVLKIQKNLSDNFKIGIKDVFLSKSINSIKISIKTSEGWSIYFGVGEDYQDTNIQIKKLELLLKDQLSEDARKKLEYINVMYKNQALYK